MSVVLITGAGSGIGKELAILFAEKNFDLFLLGKTAEKLKNVQKEILGKYKIKCNIIQYDLNNTDRLSELAENYGMETDIIINCAGIGKIGDFKSLSKDEEIKMINVNFIAPMILSRLFVEKFIGKGVGTVINICSTASLYPNPYLNVYSASKVSLLYYSLSLDKEVSVKNKNMRVLSICPGPVNTNFFSESTRKKFAAYTKYEMSAYDTAKAIIKIFERKKRFSVIGFKNRVFSGLMRLLPISLQLKIVEKFLRKGV